MDEIVNPEKERKNTESSEKMEVFVEDESDNFLRKKSKEDIAFKISNESSASPILIRSKALKKFQISTSNLLKNISEEVKSNIFVCKSYLLFLVHCVDFHFLHDFMKETNLCLETALKFAIVFEKHFESELLRYTKISTKINENFSLNTYTG